MSNLTRKDNYEILSMQLNNYESNNRRDKHELTNILKTSPKSIISYSNWKSDKQIQMKEDDKLLTQKDLYIKNIQKIDNGKNFEMDHLKEEHLSGQLNSFKDKNLNDVPCI